MAVFNYENRHRRATIVNRQIQGDLFGVKAEVERAYDKHAGKLYKYALMILADHEAAEDAVQRVFVKMMKMGNSILQIESYDGYLRRAVRNECYEIIKKHIRFRGLVDELSSMPIIEDLGKKESNEDERKVLEGAIKKLSPKEREVLHMKVYENKTLAEIGNIIDVSVNTVASRYRYALSKLRQMLGCKCEGEDEHYGL